ncbi:MAG: glycosyltransferase family 4 protein [Culicoidibacterales bacterium]
MKKVAHICTTRLMYKLLIDKLALLKEAGYEVEIISAEDYEETNIFNEIGIPQKYVDMSRELSPIEDIKSIISLVKLLKEEQYDVIHTHNAKAGLIGRIAGKIAKVPVVIHTSHGLPFFEGQSKLKYSMFKFLEIIGAKFCDALGSQNREDLIIMKSYTDTSKVFYEGNGIDYVKLQKLSDNVSQDEIEKIRKEYNILSTDKVILMGARFESVKNHDLLLKSLKELNNIKNIEFKCLLAGQGELEEQIKAEVKELGLENQVVFIGYQKEIYKFIKMADLVTLTSFKEGIPRILMESMYFAKPVVATNVLGTKEVVLDGKTGYLVELDDSKLLAKKYNELLQNVEKSCEFGNYGKEFILENYTEQIVVQRLDNLYKQLLSEKKGYQTEFVKEG